MSIRIKHCIVITCDVCGATAEDEDGGTPHFHNLDDAQEFIAGDDEHHWLFTPKEHVCPSCRARRACQVAGHRWDEWRQVDMRGIPVTVRFCWRCSEREIAAGVTT